MSKVLIVTASLRPSSNSDILAEEVRKGALESGHEAEILSLKGKQIAFCRGCLACQKTQKCVIKDDAAAIAEKVRQADTLVFATPIYYYELSGQLKTLLDRCNPLYTMDYHFRNVYLLCTAAEDEDHVPERAVAGLQGWTDCFEKAVYSGTFFGGGVNDPGEVGKKAELLEKAREFGRKLL